MSTENADINLAYTQKKVQFDKISNWSSMNTVKSFVYLCFISKVICESCQLFSSIVLHFTFVYIRPDGKRCSMLGVGGVFEDGVTSAEIAVELW